MQHALKTDPVVFDMSWRGLKDYEIRYNDRDYTIGDNLVLMETRHAHSAMRTGKPLEYTGRVIHGTVVEILEGPIYGLLPKWVIMSVRIDKRFNGDNLETKACSCGGAACCSGV